MTGKEAFNLVGWLKAQGLADDKITDCMETVEGKKKTEKKEEDKSN